MARARIVIVDDEVDLAEAFAEYLSDLGHAALAVPSGAELDVLIAQGPPDLVILDVNMPGERGLDILRRLRRDWSGPVLIITAIQDPIERVVGLELGADDFLVKPVDPQELAARVSGLLARYANHEREVLPLERTTVDLTASRLLRVGERPQRLGPGEIVLLRVFASNPNRVLTREELIEQAPAESRDAYDRSIDTRVARLRQKLDTQAIVTVRGRGYMFVPP